MSDQRDGTRELYQLPGRKRDRSQIHRLSFLACVIGLLIASAVGTQWMAWRGLRATESQPLWHLDSPQRELALALAAILIVVWILRLLLAKTTRPHWNAILVVALPTILAASVPVYRPDGLLLALYRMQEGLTYGHQTSTIEESAVIACVTFVLFAIWVSFCASNSLARVPRHGETHGSARFATHAEIQESGFLKKSQRGVVLGSHGPTLLCTDKDSHVLGYAPPGSGKSTCLAIPTLTTWRGSAVVLDFKGELFDATSGYRANILKQDVCRLDFTAEPRSNFVRFNPVLTVEKGLQEIKAAQSLAQVLVKEGSSPGSSDDGVWIPRARELLVALILHDLYCSDSPSLTSCRRRLRSGPIEHLLVEMILTKHDSTANWTDVEDRPTTTHPEVFGTALSLLGMAHETRSGVLANVEGALTEFADPLLAHNTADTDIKPGDLLDGDRPVTLYLTLPAGDVGRLKRVLAALIVQWFQQILNRKAGVYQHRLLLLLDELPVLGKIDFLQTAAPLIRGYGVQLYMLVQSLTQLDQIYGQHQTLGEICPIQLALGATDLKTAEMVARRLGKFTIDAERVSVAPGSRTTLSDADHGRPLMTADEVARMPVEKHLVLPAGSRPILADRTPYFRSKELAQRVAQGPLDSSRLKRFEHDWDSWKRNRAKRPDAEQIRQYLESWKA